MRPISGGTSKKVWRIMAAACAAMAIAVVTATAAGGPLIRVAASQNYWSGEISTTLGPGTAGQRIYRKTVPFPTRIKTAYLTMFATGDQHDDSGNGDSEAYFRCEIDGVPCNGVGWTTLANHGSNDWHDNAISMSWCAPAAPGVGHTLDIYMAADGDGDVVYLENATFYIDASNTNCPNPDVDEKPNDF